MRLFSVRFVLSSSVITVPGAKDENCRHGAFIVHIVFFCFGARSEIVMIKCYRRLYFVRIGQKDLDTALDTMHSVP